ncbi:unnamed protein product, partial [Didymodactylos carnosus]
NDLKISTILNQTQSYKKFGGDVNQNIRAQLAEKGKDQHHKLSVEEQIDCIIDQATDLKII